MIYTKKGDTGTTSLIGGTRVPKNNVRVEAYGSVDELDAHIALLAETLGPDSPQFPVLKTVQQTLFSIQTLLACEDDSLAAKMRQIGEEELCFLEQHIDNINDSLPKLNTFVLPGGSLASAQSHLARCVCRRAERQVVALQLSAPQPTTAECMRYLNRLSDYLFVLARQCAVQGRGEETIHV